MFCCRPCCRRLRKKIELFGPPRLRQCLAQVRKLFGETGAAAINVANDQLTLDASMFDIPACRVIDGFPTDAAVMIAAGPGFLEGFSARSDTNGPLN